MSIIQIQRLTKRYGHRTGAEDISLSVPEGSLFGFLGPNGSGKTTTIRVLMGLLRPSSGRAMIFGKDCWNESHRIKAEVGYVPGDLRLYSSMNARELLIWVRQVRGQSVRDDSRELLTTFELDERVRVRAMSRGMRQKLGLIMALAHRPRLLILDEPTTALDPVMQERLCLHLRRLASEGHTVFFSSHTLSEVEMLCDRVVILRQGRLVADEPLADFRARARRVVIIRWPQGNGRVPQEAPAFLDVFDRRPFEWHAELRGPVTDLVRWSAEQSLEDLSIGQPDLNRLFQQFYKVNLE